MLDRSSDLANIMRKLNGGNMSGGGNIKRVQVKPKTPAKSNIRPSKKCNSCSRKKKA